MSSKILCGSVPLAGHLAPMLPLARQLQADGHQVEFVSHPRVRDGVERQGLRLREDFEWGSVAVDIIERSTVEGGFLLRLIKERKLTAGFYLFVYELEDAVRECLRVIDESRPDGCFFDILFFPGILAAEIRELPYALSCPVPSPLASGDLLPYSFGFPSAQKKMRAFQRPLEALSRGYWALNTRYVNRVRETFALPPMSDIISGCVSPYLYLSYTTGRFEYARSDLPAQVYYIGPTLTPGNEAAEEEFPWSWLDGRPLVYCTMGTLQGRRKTFDRVIDASRAARWQVIISIGRLFDTGDFADAPDNVLVTNWAPQAALVECADVVVCHGGFNTLNDALYRGLPVLALPQAWDHFESAQRIVEAGAGMRIDPHQATTKRIRQSIEQLLENASMKKSAAQIAEDFAMCDAVRCGARLIAEMARTQAPVLRAATTPPTIYWM